MSPLLLICFAIRDRVWGNLNEAFIYALELVEGKSFPSIEGLNIEGLTQCKEKILSILRELDEQDQERLFSEYLDCVRSQEEGLLENFDEADLAAEFCRTIDAGQAEGLDDHLYALRDITSIEYSCIAAHALGTFRLNRLLLGPLWYWIALPFTPYDTWRELSSCLARIVSNIGIISIEQLQIDFKRRGINISPGFLQALSLCEPSTVATSNPLGQVASSTKMIPRLRLVGSVAKRNEYVDWDRVFVPSDGESQAGYLSKYPRIRINDMAEFFKRVGSEPSKSIAPEACGLKLLQCSLGGEKIIQGLNASLHVGIVNALLKRQRAMTRTELEAVVGFSIPIGGTIKKCVNEEGGVAFRLEA